MTRKTPELYQSSENIFADLGLTDPPTHMLKAQIVTELYRLTTERKLNQTQAVTRARRAYGASNQGRWGNKWRPLRVLRYLHRPGMALSRDDVIA